MIEARSISDSCFSVKPRCKLAQPMKSSSLIREARLRAGLTQAEMADKTGRDRSVIARWEQGVVAPSVETLVDLVRACGFDIPLELVPFDTSDDSLLKKTTMLSPDRRLNAMVRDVARQDAPHG